MSTEMADGGELRVVLLEKVPEEIADRILGFLREVEKEGLHELLRESLPAHMAGSITAEELDRLYDKRAIVLKRLAAMPGTRPKKEAAKRFADALKQSSPKKLFQKLRAGYCNRRQGLFPAIHDRPSCTSDCT